MVLTPFLPRASWPIRPHADGSLTHLVHTEQPSVDRRFAFYLELDDATDGGVLVVPVDSFVDPELVEGFAELEVVVRSYDPAIPSSIAEPPQLGVVETGNGDLPYSIVPGDDDLWWLAITADGVIVIPESAAPVPGGRP